MDFFRHITIVLAAAVAAAAYSCSRPDQIESYVSSSQRTPSGFYEFTVDMSDESSSYDLFLYTRSDCRERLFSTLPDLGVVMIWTSPEGTEYREMVYIPHDDFESDTSFSHYAKVPYRTGLVPVQRGVWKLTMAVPEGDRFNLRGMGLIVHQDRNLD